MTLKTKRSGAWVTPANGTIKVKSGGVWRTVTALSVRWSGSWQGSGYVGTVGAPTGLVATTLGNGDNKTTTFQWTAPSTGATPTGYRVSYQSTFGGTVVSSTVSFGTNTKSITFPGSAGAAYYVWVTAFDAATESGQSNIRRLTLGSPSSSGFNGGWSPTLQYLNAAIWDASSSQSGYEPYRAGDFSSGSGTTGTPNFSTSWGSANHASQSSSSEWEALDIMAANMFAVYSPPGVKLARIRFGGAALPAQFWLAVRSAGVWGINLYLSSQSPTGPTAAFVMAPGGGTGGYWQYFDRATMMSVDGEGYTRTPDLSGYNVILGPNSTDRLYATFGLGFPANITGNYWVAISNIQVGFYPWDPLLNPYSISATANTDAAYP